MNLYPVFSVENFARHLGARVAAIILLFTVSVVGVRAELIPTARLTDWTPRVRVGVVGGIPAARTTIFATITATGDSTDRTAEINAALAACPADQVVLLGAGTFRCDGALAIGPNDDHITLRGAGIGVTIIDARAGSPITVGSNSDYTWAWPPSNNVVTAGLSQGGTVLTIADTSAFSVGQIVRVAFENQMDNTAIRSGAVPAASTSGYPELRTQKNRVVAKTGTSLTLAHPIYHAPGAGLSARVNVAQAQTDGAGIEELTIDGLNGTMFAGITFSQAANCWVKNVRSINTSNYHVYFTDSVNCELRRCVLDGRKTGGSNGAGLLMGASSACLIEDNIIANVFPNVEVNFSSSGNVFAYNVFENTPVGGAINFAVDTNHAPHNSYNLYEGNVAPNFIADGYFGGVSEDTIFRNWIHSSCLDSSATTYSLSLKRFTRNYSVVGNIVGKTGVAGGFFSYGQPNIGNGSSTGTAQPTAGNFWNDWKATATLTKRTGDRTGVMTLASGLLTTDLFITVRWGASMAQFYPTSVVGNVVTFGTVYQGAILPAEGTALTVFMGPGGYQELDLDVAASTIDKGNYVYASGGIAGSMSSLGGDTLPDSQFRSAKPAYFGSLAWPPFSPTSPNAASYDAIPAGYRFAHGIDPPAGGSDTSAPSVPTGVTAMTAGAGQINLAWTASTDNVGVSNYLLERSQGAGSINFVQVATSAGTSRSDAGLTASTTYNYRIRAIDGAGNVSGYSSIVAATTTNTPVDMTSPTVPQTLLAVANGPTQINLSWSASTDNVGVVGYQMERSQGAGSTAFVAITPPATLGGGDAGLSPATVYNYRVRATDAAGNLSGYSNVATATTANLPDATAPTAPANLSAVANGQNQINLTWSASTDNVAVTGYLVERAQGAGATGFLQVAVSAGNSYGDMELTAATDYNYRVRAVDAAGNLSGYSGLSTVTTPSPVPMGLVAAYFFEEAAGNSATDSSGNGNTGTIYGATRTTEGRFGRALAFNGVDNVVVVNSSPSLAVTSQTTLAAWVYPTTLQSGWRAILHKETDAWYLHACNPDGPMHPAGGAIFNGGEKYVGAPAVLPLNEWTHLASTYDGATLRLYVNGNEVSSRALIGNIEVNSMPLRIGGNSYANQFFAGKIDEIRLYNRALSPFEIQAAMNTPMGSPKPPTGLRLVAP